MVDHGVPAIIASRRLGHSRISIILDIYGHLISELQSEAADLIDKPVTPVLIKLNTTAHEFEKVSSLEIKPPIYRQKRTFPEKNPTFSGVPDGI
jgi:hypothetical protein